MIVSKRTFSLMKLALDPAASPDEAATVALQALKHAVAEEAHEHVRDEETLRLIVAATDSAKPIDEARKAALAALRRLAEKESVYVGESDEQPEAPAQPGTYEPVEDGNPSQHTVRTQYTDMADVFRRAEAAAASAKNAAEAEDEKRRRRGGK